MQPEHRSASQPLQRLLQPEQLPWPHESQLREQSSQRSHPQRPHVQLSSSLAQVPQSLQVTPCQSESGT